MRNPLLGIAAALRKSGQTEAIPGRTDQLRNCAGGYVFAVDDWMRLRRFLLIGTEGGTYYVGERELTQDNAGVVFRLLEQDGLRVVDLAVEVSESGAAPRQHPALFTLAAAASVGDEATRAAALTALPQVCRTGTHLFLWNAYAEGMRGWGRARSRAVANWYLRDPQKVAYQAIKYRQREGWSHRDLLRLAHPKAVTPVQSALFDFVCGRTPESGVLPLVDAFLEASAAGTTTERIVQLVALGLPWEALPDEHLDQPAVWDALLEDLGATALLRQLPRLTRISLLKPLRTLDPRLRKLVDPDVLKRARVHPVAVLNALFGYKSGVSRGGRSWVPVPAVIDLLDEAFHASFGAIEPSGKRTLIGLDVSGSMTWSNLASLPALTAADASAAMAMATVRSEPEVFVTAFSDRLIPLPITARHSLAEVQRIVSEVSFGRTDCAQPMLWAAENRLDVETFVTFTDSETWAGNLHPTQALVRYREQSGNAARMAVTAMTSTGFTIADPADAGQLDLVGFDAGAPRLLAEFARGEL